MKIKITVAIVLLLAMGPIIAGYLGPGWFSGLRDPLDGNTYLSFIHQAYTGNLLFTNYYTLEQVPSIMFRPIFLMGSIFSFLPEIGAYHIIRLIGIILLLSYLYALTGHIAKDNRYWIWLIGFLSSGFGLGLVILHKLGFNQYLSVDLWIPEANNFTVILGQPHFIFSVAFMIMMVYHLFCWIDTKSQRHIALAGFAMFMIGFEHLFDNITLCFALALWFFDLLIRQRKLRFDVAFGLLPLVPWVLIPVIYTFAVFSFVPEFVSWNAQNVLPTGKFYYVFAGYGFLLLAVIPMIKNLRNKSTKNSDLKIRFLVYWIIATAILIYSPFNIQRRFLEGVHIPLALLFSYWLFSNPVYFRLRANIPKFAPLLVLLLLIPTNVYLYTQYLQYDQTQEQYPFAIPKHLSQDQYEALVWLSQNMEPTDTLFASYTIGNYLPRFTNNRVYAGHWAQTIDAQQKVALIPEIYASQEFPTSHIWYNRNSGYPQPNGDIVYENQEIQIIEP